MTVEELTKLASIIVPIIFGGGGIYLWRKDKAEANKIKADADKILSDKQVSEFNAVITARKDLDTQMIDRFNTLNQKVADLENEVSEWKAKTYKLIDAIRLHLIIHADCANGEDLAKVITSVLGD